MPIIKIDDRLELCLGGDETWQECREHTRGCYCEGCWMFFERLRFEAPGEMDAES
jgi:hypothetical protein